jgi:hypothetical protein
MEKLFIFAVLEFFCRVKAGLVTFDTFCRHPVDIGHQPPLSISTEVPNMALSVCL